MSADTPGALSDAQLRHFADEGFVVVAGLVAEPQLADYRAQFWSEVGADADDPTSWPEAPPGGGQLPNIMALEPNIGELAGIAAVVEQLGGGRFVGGGSMTKAIFPAAFPLSNGVSEWQAPTGQHIDGYANAWNNNPQVCANPHPIPPLGPQLNLLILTRRSAPRYTSMRSPSTAAASASGLGSTSASMSTSSDKSKQLNTLN